MQRWSIIAFCLLSARLADGQWLAPTINQSSTAADARSSSDTLQPPLATALPADASYLPPPTSPAATDLPESYLAPDARFSAPSRAAQDRIAANGNCRPSVISEPWCRRPFYLDVFAGPISGNEVIVDRMAQHTSFFAGLRLGLDMDESWGLETRLGWSDLAVSDLDGTPNRRNGNLFVWDMNLVHYLFTGPTLRPYFSIGLGLADFEFVDDNGLWVNEQVPQVPLGIGIKQRVDDWLVLRFDLTDTITFGGGEILGTDHNVSATGSLEWRFGGSRTSYWPWARRRFYWDW